MIICKATPVCVYNKTVSLNGNWKQKRGEGVNLIERINDNYPISPRSHDELFDFGLPGSVVARSIQAFCSPAEPDANSRQARLRKKVEPSSRIFHLF